MYNDPSSSCFNVATTIALQREQASLLLTLIEQGKITVTTRDSGNIELF